MRLIDADALIEKRTHAKNYSPEMYVIGQGYVMDAPTIPSMEQGRWVWHSYDEIFNSGKWTITNKFRGNGFECSNCGTLVEEETILDCKYKYCPYCGAKMSNWRIVKGEL